MGMLQAVGAYIVGLLSTVFYAILNAGSAITGSSAEKFAGYALQIVHGLSERPLALFGLPSFAAVAATITMAYSRCVLMAASRERMTTREMVELAARVGRTSQRMLFLPVLGATLLSGITSRVALGLAQAVAVPLAFLYVSGSLLFLRGEMQTWRITSRDLLQHPRRQNLVSYSEAVDVFSPERVLSGDCCICLEPFPQADETPDAKEAVDKPIRVAVQVRMQNGPRDLLRRPMQGSLEVCEVVPSEVGVETSSQIHCTDSTKHGEWILILNAGTLYRVRLINSSRSLVVTEFTLLVCLANAQGSSSCNCGQATDVRLQLARRSEANGGAFTCEPISWFFDGVRRPCGEARSEVQLFAMQADARDAGLASRGTPSVEMPLLVTPEGQKTKQETAESAPAVLRTLRCGHTFHEHCIAAWCQQSTRQAARCPLCREVLSGRGRVSQILF